MTHLPPSSSLFFSSVTAPTEIYTLSLHDALPIYLQRARAAEVGDLAGRPTEQDQEGAAHGEAQLQRHRPARADRKSTRLNSSHTVISYAVFCLKKKKTTTARHHRTASHRRRELRD